MTAHSVSKVDLINIDGSVFAHTYVPLPIQVIQADERYFVRDAGTLVFREVLGRKVQLVLDPPEKP